MQPCREANKKNGFSQQGLFVSAICDQPIGGSHGWHYFCERVLSGWTVKKIPACERASYTRGYALSCILDSYNNTYNAYYYHIWNYDVRKQQKLPDVFLCRFLTNFPGFYWSRGPPHLLCAFPWLKLLPKKKFFKEILKNLSGLGQADLS